MSTAYHRSSFNLLGVNSGTSRIIHADIGHFWALFFFILPLSFSLIFHPTLQSQSLFFFSYFDTPNNKTELPLSLQLLYSLFVLVLSILAVATITYSSFQLFYGRPVNLVSSIKSVLYTFLPLLSTFIFHQFINALTVLFFSLLVALMYMCLLVSGFDTDLLQSNYFRAYVFLVGIVVLVTLIWLQVNWSFWSVIVVVESKWGYESFRRSLYLLNGMRRVALSVMLFYGFSIGIFVWGSSTSVANARHTNGWLNWSFVLSTLISSGCINMLICHFVVANMVLYMYCRALNGEFPLELAEEFGRDVSLSCDCENVARFD